MSLLCVRKNTADRTVEMFSDGICCRNGFIISNNSIKILKLDDDKMFGMVGETQFKNFVFSYIKNNFEKTFVDYYTRLDNYEFAEKISEFMTKILTKFHENPYCKDKDYIPDSHMVIVIKGVIYEFDIYVSGSNCSVINEDIYAIGYGNEVANVLLKENYSPQTLLDVVSKNYVYVNNNLNLERINY